MKPTATVHRPRFSTHSTTRWAVQKYGSAAVKKQTRSINVDFGVAVDADDNTNYRILSVDVVPAYAGDGYSIPDTSLGRWIRTNPEIHAQKAVARATKPTQASGKVSFA